MQVMRQISRRFQLLAIALFGAALLLGGCQDGRNATTPGELYHCASDGDCLSGWSCQCGYCQQTGVAQQYPCGVVGADTTGDGSLSGDSADASTGSDSASTDAGSTDAGSDAIDPPPPVGTPLGICNQAVSSDVVFANCNLSDWTGCASGYGCYYGPAIKKTLCKKHTSFAENAACDPCNLTECGVASDSHVLICDAVDKICRRTCDATIVGTGVKPGQCPTGQKCYQLVDSNNVAYPSQGGICAP